MFLSFITSKLGIGLIAMVVLSGGAFYMKTLIENQALMKKELDDREMALEGLASEFSNYALNSEAVIEAYNINNEVLQKDYQRSRDIVAVSIERSIKHDYQKLLDADTSAFITRANRATARVLLGFEENTVDTKDNADRKDTEASLP